MQVKKRMAIQRNARRSGFQLLGVSNCQFGAQNTTNDEKLCHYRLQFPVPGESRILGLRWTKTPCS
jgi:hypothetical protein